MSGYIGPDDVSLNTPHMSSTAVPSSPILNHSSSSTGNYSSMDCRQSDGLPEKDADLSSVTVNLKGPTYSYEELSNGLTCPTCKGTGKIPRGQEDDLVALIPYNDKRLKPQRTWLYVSLSFALCIIIAGILCAFLIPRSIEVVHDNVTTLHVDLNVSEDICFLQLMSIYNVTNNNFVSVTANNIDIQVTVLFYNRVIRNLNFVLNKQVGIRSAQQLFETLNMTLTKHFFPISYCEPSQIHDNRIYMMFQTTFNFTLMTQTDQQTVVRYFRINCNPETVLDQSPWVQSVGYAEVPDALIS